MVPCPGNGPHRVLNGPEAGDRAAYPGGRASKACAAGRGDWVPEAGAGSSGSPGTDGAGRVGVSFDTAAGGEVTPTTDLSSSVSVAPAESPFTENAEGREIRAE